MKIRQQRRKIIGASNLDESIQTEGLNKSVRSRSYAPSKEEGIVVAKFMESNVERRFKHLVAPTIVDNKQIRKPKDDFNLAKLAVMKHDHLGEPNLYKLAAIKKCMIEKYDQKKNYLEIFKLWDGQGKGHVSASNIKQILAAMNIRITDKEAQILLTSADMRQANSLGACDFIGFLLDQETSLTRPNDLMAKLNKKDDVIEFLREENRQREDKRNIDHVFDQYELKLQNLLYQQANKMKRGFEMLDMMSQGQVNKEQFTKVFRKMLYLRDVIVSDQDLESIYQEHKITNNSFDYTSFLQEIKSSHLKQIPDVEVKPRIEYVPRILEHQRLSIPSLDRMKKQAHSLVGQLKNNYHTEEEFKHFLKSHFDVDEVRFASTTITQGQLKEALMKGMGVQGDMNAMLNLFVYNPNNEIGLASILKPLYNENAMEMYQRLNVVERGFAPRRDEIFKADWEKEKQREQLIQSTLVQSNQREDDDDDMMPSRKKTMKMLNLVRSHQSNQDVRVSVRAKSQLQDSVQIGAQRNSSMYITEERRLNNDKSSFSRDEKLQRMDKDANRLLRIRDTSDAYNNRIKDQEERSYMKMQSNLQERQRQRANYDCGNAKIQF